MPAALPARSLLFAIAIAEVFKGQEDQKRQYQYDIGPEIYVLRHFPIARLLKLMGKIQSNGKYQMERGPFPGTGASLQLTGERLFFVAGGEVISPG